MAPRISLCLIARNEEAMLPGCLASIRGAADEVVLVDTGSSARTIAIARSAGARVLEQPWNDDFSASRNLALEHATGAWILQLDADERLAAGAAGVIRHAVGAQGADALFLRLHDAQRADAPLEDVVSGAARRGDPISLMRLFRRLRGVRYRGAIHESVGESLAERRARFASVPADVVHAGGAPDVRARLAKQARNVAILRRCCQEEPDNATWYGYLAMELQASGSEAEAKDVAERGWSVIDRQPRSRSLNRLAIARSMIAMNGRAPATALETIAVLERRQRVLGSDALMLGGIAHLQLALDASGDARRQHAEMASDALRAALARGGDTEPLIPGSSSWASSAHLGTARLLARDFAGALEAFRAHRRDPEDAGVSLGVAECQLELGDPAAAAKQLSASLLDGRPDGWVLAARTAYAVGATADARAWLAEAHRRLPGGFLAPHRREAAQQLADALGAAHR